MFESAMTTKALQRSQLNERRRERSNIAVEIRNIVADLTGLKPNRIKPKINLRDDLAIDSFTALEIIVAMEHKYGLIITEKDISKLITFQDLIECVCLWVEKHESL